MATAKVPLTDNDKFELLKTLLIENQKELVFWRKRNWSALRDIAGGLIALSSVSLFQAKAALVLLLLVAAIAAIGAIYLKKNYERYQEKLEIRSKIEEALSLYDNNIFLDNQKLLPDQLKTPKADPRGTYSFITAIYILAAATALSIVVRSCAG